MALGLAVDYCVHIGHAFDSACRDPRSLSNQAAAKQAVMRMGASVFQGGARSSAAHAPLETVCLRDERRDELKRHSSSETEDAPLLHLTMPSSHSAILTLYLPLQLRSCIRRALQCPRAFAGFTTLLGILVLALASSVAFRTLFRFVLGTVLLGIAHGVVLLPVLLTYLTPRTGQPIEIASKHAPASAAGDGVLVQA